VRWAVRGPFNVCSDDFRDEMNHDVSLVIAADFPQGATDVRVVVSGHCPEAAIAAGRIWRIRTARSYAVPVAVRVVA
jgi:hypothetical protein